MDGASTIWKTITLRDGLLIDGLETHDEDLTVNIFPDDDYYLHQYQFKLTNKPYPDDSKLNWTIYLPNVRKSMGTINLSEIFRSAEHFKRKDTPVE